VAWRSYKTIAPIMPIDNVDTDHLTLIWKKLHNQHVCAKGDMEKFYCIYERLYSPPMAEMTIQHNTIKE